MFDISDFGSGSSGIINEEDIDKIKTVAVNNPEAFHSDIESYRIARNAVEKAIESDTCDIIAPEESSWPQMTVTQISDDQFAVKIDSGEEKPSYALVDVTDIDVDDRAVSEYDTMIEDYAYYGSSMPEFMVEADEARAETAQADFALDQEQNGREGISLADEENYSYFT